MIQPPLPGIAGGKDPSLAPGKAKPASLVEESKAMYSKSPLKLKDPSCFTVPCEIEGTHFDKALYDIGASISLMPYSIYKKLDLEELKPTNMCLSMAEKSITYPLGILKIEPKEWGNL